MGKSVIKCDKKFGGGPPKSDITLFSLSTWTKMQFSYFKKVGKKIINQNKKNKKKVENNL